MISLLFQISLFSRLCTNFITGTVLDKSSKQPVEFATVQLLKPVDSSILKTTVTNRKGKFILNNIEDGNYIIRCSFIGCGVTLLPVAVDQKKENVGIIEITYIKKNLSEVSLTTRKSLLNTSIDRKVYNVSQDIMAQSGSAI